MFKVYWVDHLLPPEPEELGGGEVDGEVVGDVVLVVPVEVGVVVVHVVGVEAVRVVRVGRALERD